MGTIYRAEHTLIGRPAAVKVLNPEYARDRAVVTRFFNEARAATAIVMPGHGDDTTIGAESPHLQEWVDRGW